jgi:GNAT superfamily N-acetyltransferase
MAEEWRKADYVISTDNSRLDLDVIHRYLTASYWAEGIPFDIVERSIRNSLNFGLYKRDVQIGFARVITDRATYAYLADVFVLEAHRGEGLGKWLIESIVSHPELQGLRRWSLVTRDAHGLYRLFGFSELKRPETYMEKLAPEIYRKGDHG